MQSALLKLSLLTFALAVSGCQSLSKRPVPPTDTKAAAPVVPALGLAKRSPNLTPRLVQALSQSQPMAMPPSSTSIPASTPMQVSAAE